MSVLNINTGTQSFNQGWGKSRRKPRSIETDFGLKTAKHVSSADLVDLDAERSNLPSESLNRRIVDAESNISVVQTAVAGIKLLEEKLGEIEKLLMKNHIEKQSNQQELEKHLDAYDGIAEQVCFDGETLLDGSHNINGAVSGEYLELIKIGHGLLSSPVSGYPVRIECAATRAEMNGKIPLSQKLINDGENMLLQEGTSQVSFTTRCGDDLEKTIKRMKNLIESHSLQIDVKISDGGILHLRHRQYGSSFSFRVASKTPGILSEESGQISVTYSGMDVVGTINSESCYGSGQLLRAGDDSKRIGGLVLRYFGENVLQSPYEAGRITIFRNSPCFTNGMNSSNSIRLAIQDLRSKNLGQNIENLSGFTSLAEIGNLSDRENFDALKILEKALREVKEEQSKLQDYDRFRYRLDALKKEYELCWSAEMLPKDGNQARRVAERTREQIIRDSWHSTVAQAHQKSETVYTLLK